MQAHDLVLDQAENLLAVGFLDRVRIDRSSDPRRDIAAPRRDPELSI